MVIISSALVLLAGKGRCPLSLDVAVVPGDPSMAFISVRSIPTIRAKGVMIGNLLFSKLLPPIYQTTLLPLIFRPNLDLLATMCALHESHSISDIQWWCKMSFYLESMPGIQSYCVSACT